MVSNGTADKDSPALLDKKYLFFVLIGALIINLVVWLFAMFSQDIHFHLKPYLQLDSYDYLKLGKHIFNEGEFPSFFRTPVYPYFVGFFQVVLNLNISQLILVQIVLSILNLYLLWRLTSHFLAARYQLFVMLVFAADLVTIQVTNYVISETLFSFLLLTSLNLLVHLKFRRNSLWLALLCGICFGLFALCRPVGQFLPYLLILWFLFSMQNKNKLMVILMAALILCGSMSVLEIWKQRNYRLTGHSFVSNTTAVNLYNYRAAWNVARRDHRPFADVKAEFQKNKEDFVRENKHLSSYEIAQHFHKEGLEIIFSTPWETMQQAARGLVYLYGGIYNASLNRLFGDGLLALLTKIYSVIYLLLVYAGLIFSVYFYKRLSKNQQSLVMLSGIIIGYFTFFSIAVESYARLRVPFFPYLVIVSVVGWSMFIGKKFLKKSL